MGQNYTFKKKKDDDGGGIVGKIVTVFFVVILLAGGYFLFNMFKGVEINPVNISGEWKLAGNPSLILTINADGTAHSYEKFTTGDIRNDADYTYTLAPNEGGVMVLTLTNVKTKETEEIKITKVSQAQMSVTRNVSSFEAFTKVNLF